MPYQVEQSDFNPLSGTSNQKDFECDILSEQLSIDLSIIFVRYKPPKITNFFLGICRLPLSFDPSICIMSKFKVFISNRSEDMGFQTWYDFSYIKAKVSHFLG